MTDEAPATRFSVSCIFFDELGRLSDGRQSWIGLRGPVYKAQTPLPITISRMWVAVILVTEIRFRPLFLEGRIEFSGKDVKKFNVDFGHVDPKLTEGATKVQLKVVIPIVDLVIDSPGDLLVFVHVDSSDIRAGRMKFVVDTE
jgi:hypothetical protein